MKVYASNSNSNSATVSGGALGFRLLAAILQAMDKGLIRSQAVTGEMLSHDLNAAITAIQNQTSERELVPLVGEASRSIEDYFKSLSTNLDALGTDLQMSLRALAQVSQTVIGSQTEVLKRIARIEYEFRNARSLDDIHKIREHMDSCLQHLQQEIAGGIAAVKENNASLEAAIERADALASQVAPLPDGSTTKGISITLIRVRRLAQFRERYGMNVTQQIRDYMTQLVMTRWPNEVDCRFYPPECLAVVDPKNSDLDYARHIMRRVAGERIVYLAKVQDREVLLQLTLDWTVRKIQDEAELADVIPAFLKQQVMIERRPVSAVDPFA